MGEWMDGWMEGWRDEGMMGWMDGGMDGWMDDNLSKGHFTFLLWRRSPLVRVCFHLGQKVFFESCNFNPTQNTFKAGQFFIA